MPGSVIVAGARTPIGKMGGALASFSAMDLGGFAISAALERAGVTGADVDYVVLGHVIRAGQGQIPARQAAVKGGIPMSVPALSIDKVCLSGLEAIALADLFVSSGVHRRTRHVEPVAELQWRCRYDGGPELDGEPVEPYPGDVE